MAAQGTRYWALGAKQDMLSEKKKNECTGI
jgi:hypothetical protein